MAAVNELCPVVGTQAACEILGLPRASFYRQQRPTFGPSKKAVSARALSLTERGAVLACLHEERFQDRSPAVVFATLLDEGVYHCSLRTMYRILARLYGLRSATYPIGTESPKKWSKGNLRRKNSQQQYTAARLKKFADFLLAADWYVVYLRLGRLIRVPLSRSGRTSLRSAYVHLRQVFNQSCVNKKPLLEGWEETASQPFKNGLACSCFAKVG